MRVGFFWYFLALFSSSIAFPYYNDEDSEITEKYASMCNELKTTIDRVVVLEIVPMFSEKSSWIRRYCDEDVKHIVLINGEVASADGVFVVQGSQLDTALLSSICTNYGPFNLIVDSNVSSVGEMTTSTFRQMFPCMSSQSFYVLQGSLVDDDDVPSSSVKEMIYVFTKMHNFWVEDHSFDDEVYSRSVKAIELLHNLIVVERSIVDEYHMVYRGNVRIPYEEIAYLELGMSDGRVLKLNVSVGQNSNVVPHADINALCRSVCAEYPQLVFGTLSDKECLSMLKRHIIETSYLSYDRFLQDDES